MKNLYDDRRDFGEDTPGGEDFVDEQDAVNEREIELDDAIYDLLSIFVPDLPEESADFDRIYEDLKDITCVYLYKEHGISVYRPMFLEDENGEEVYTDYPYPEMEL